MNFRQCHKQQNEREKTDISVKWSKIRWMNTNLNANAVKWRIYTKKFDLIMIFCYCCRCFFCCCFCCWCGHCSYISDSIFFFAFHLKKKKKNRAKDWKKKQRKRNDYTYIKCAPNTIFSIVRYARMKLRESVTNWTKNKKITKEKEMKELSTESERVSE